jgi:hypothetical protein
MGHQVVGYGDAMLPTQFRHKALKFEAQLTIGPDLVPHAFGIGVLPGLIAGHAQIRKQYRGGLHAVVAQQLRHFPNKLRAEGVVRVQVPTKGLNIILDHDVISSKRVWSRSQVWNPNPPLGERQGIPGSHMI